MKSKTKNRTETFSTKVFTNRQENKTSKVLDAQKVANLVAEDVRKIIATKEREYQQ